MAAPSYTEDLTDVTLAENTTNWSAYGGGASGLSASPDLAMQGTNCVDKQITNADKGQYYDNGSGITLGTGDHVFIWHFCGTPGLTDTIQNKGASVLIGTGGTAYCQYHVEGNDTYGASGRVARCYPIDYSVRSTNASAPYRTATGSPGANPQVFGGGLVTTASVKGANVGIDAIRYGTGAYLTAGELISAGDASDDPCTFAGFQGQNDSSTNRWGILTSVGGSLELQGRFVIGQNNAQTATLCRFQDSDKNLVIVDTIHSASDFTQIIVDHASTVCNLTNINIAALGTTNPGRFIVNSADPEVNITGGTWSDLGIITFRSNTTADSTVFRRTDQITQNSATLTDCLIDSNINASAVLSNNPSTITGTTFVSDGTGHALELTATGTYSLTDNVFSGYAAVDGSTGNESIYNNSGGAITINNSGSSGISVRNGAGASTTVNSAVTITLNGLIAGSRVYIENTTDTVVLFNEIEATTTFSDTVNYTADKSLSIKIRNASGATKYKTFETTGTLTSSGFTLTVNQELDE